MPEIPSGHVDKIDIKCIRNQLDPGQRHRAGQVRLDAATRPHRPLPGSKEQVRRHPVPGRADDQHLLLLDEHDKARRSTTSRCARRSTTRSTPKPWSGSTPARSRAPSRSCRPDARLQEVRTLPAQHGQGEGTDQAEANPTDRNITVWTDSESPNSEAGAYYQDVLKKLGFNAKLKIINADNYFTVIGNLSTPNLDTGLGRLVRGLSRTRTTSSTCCSQAKASCRPTTRTSPRSTSRR